MAVTTEERNAILNNFDTYTDIKKSRLQAIMRYLQNSTFLVRDKDTVSERDYRLAMYEMKTLRFILEDLQGYKILTQPEFGVIRLTCDTDTDEEEKGKRVVAASRVWLDKKAADLLSLLFIIYDERSVTTIKNGVHKIRISDLKAEMEKRNIDKEYMSNGFVKVLKSYLNIFKRHNLIDFKNDLDIKDEDSEIKLYPSLMFALNADEYKKFVEQNTKERFEDKDDTTDPDYEDFDEEEEE